MKIKIALISYLGILMVLLAGCKQVQKVVIEKKVKPITVRRVVRLVSDNELKFNTLSIKKVSLTYNNNGEENSFRGMVKIRKDSILQISAQKLAIPLGKMEVGIDSFRVVQHIGKKVMTGLIQEIGDLFGYDMDYQIIESIFSNHLQSIKTDQKENPFRDYVMAIEENMYKISSIRERRFRKFVNNGDKLERFKQRKDEQYLVKQDIFIDPDLFVVRKELFHDIDSGRIITIEYSEFKAIGNNWFPANLHISVSGKEKLDIQAELSRVSINDERDFGFSVPSRYKKVALKGIKTNTEE